MSPVFASSLLTSGPARAETDPRGTASHGDRGDRQDASTLPRRVEAVLQGALARAQRQRLAVVCSLDGMVFCSTGAGDSSLVQRLAAITATMLSVSSGAAREVGGSRALELLIGTDGAQLVMHSVGTTYGVCVVAELACPPGILLSNARRLVGELDRLLSQGAG